MGITTGSQIEDFLTTIGVLIFVYLLLGLALWLQFPQPKNQGAKAFAKGVALLPLLYLVGFMLRRGKTR